MLPIGSDDTDLRDQPFLTYAIIAENVFVFFVLQDFGRNERFTYGYALVPYEFLSGHDLVTQGDYLVDMTKQKIVAEIPQGFLHLQPSPEPVYLTLLSSMFMHGSLMHLLGNMLFLLIFGKHLEDALGMFRFLIFYLVAGVSASLIHILFSQEVPSIVIPCLGASGAVSGVMAAYVMLFPHKLIQALVGFLPIAVPAWVFIGVWFIFQLINGMGTFGDPTGGGIAYAAHIGGFLVGLALIVPFSTGREIEESYWRYH
ncbi:MAG TPA: rhomboid family intramembrane serine protease [Gemmatales bacterium]|nr:rhomboid family intramembrane serine protease [Gemmatales bacterium]